MKHPALSLLLASAAFTAATGPALADRRAFTFTYEYVTQPEGNLELEYYNTQARSRFGDGGVSSMSQQLEIEYGITDHTDVSLYQVVEQEGAGGLRYAETKLRARHRFAERGELPVDTLLYLELVKAFGTSAYELEPKLILGKDRMGTSRKRSTAPSATPTPASRSRSSCRALSTQSGLRESSRVQLV